MNAGSCKEKSRRKESVMSTAATMRVLNVLRHWVSKHAQDFELDHKLKQLTIEFLEDIIYSSNLLPAEHKASSQLLRLLTKEEHEGSKIDLNQLLSPPKVILVSIYFLFYKILSVYSFISIDYCIIRLFFIFYITRFKQRRTLKPYQLWK